MSGALHKMAALLRLAARLVWLAAELAWAALRLKGRDLFRGRSRKEGQCGDERALWLHHTCRRVVRVLSPRINIGGPVPARGLLVANHVSYVDIIVLSSLTPCIFVAKHEVQRWPVFGWFARRGGTLFVNRASRQDASRVVEQIRATLEAGALVVLFPEGTSSDGSAVLPFKSSLLEAAAGEPESELRTAEQEALDKSGAAGSATGHAVAIAALHYQPHPGEESADVCYWGDHTLAPHLLRLLSKRGVNASVAFAEIQNARRDRKSLARQLHAEVSALHDGLKHGLAGHHETGA